MGDIADSLLDGTFDEQTGEYIGEAVGYPRTLQKGFYNSVGRKKHKRNLKHAMKGQSLGGLHLVGKEVYVAGIGNCLIEDYVGKRGKKAYVVLNDVGIRQKVKFSRLIFDKTLKDEKERDGFN